LAATPEPDRPLMLPYLDGERTPDRPDARGVFAGFSGGVTREQMARAAFEGVLCGLLGGLDALQAAGASAGGRVVLTGGGAISPAYRQLLADLLGAPVWTSPLSETSASGAAVQAAAVLRKRPIEELAMAWAPPLQCVAEPRTGQAAAELRGRYQRLSALAALDRVAAR
jgi:xylulokinase